MKSASVWLPLYSSVWWIKALGSSCVEQVYPDSSATASDSESTRRMLRIESCATVPKPYFLNVDTCFFFSPQVSHLVTFTLSCASISMLMTAWECVCVWTSVRQRGRDGETTRSSEEEWQRESLSSCEVAFVWQMNGWMGEALSARRHAALTSEHSWRKQGKQRTSPSPPVQSDAFLLMDP